MRRQLADSRGAAIITPTSADQALALALGVLDMLDRTNRQGGANRAGEAYGRNTLAVCLDELDQRARSGDLPAAWRKPKQARVPVVISGALMVRIAILTDGERIGVQFTCSCGGESMIMPGPAAPVPVVIACPGRCGADFTIDTSRA